MHTHIDEAADDAADDDHDHAEQRHAGVERADAKRRVHEDQPRPHHAQHHVQHEPGLDAADTMQGFDVLAQRVDKEQRHHQAAADGEPVADVVASAEPADAADLPCAADQQHDGDVDERVTAQPDPAAAGRAGWHRCWAGADHLGRRVRTGGWTTKVPLVSWQTCSRPAPPTAIRLLKPMQPNVRAGRSGGPPMGHR